MAKYFVYREVGWQAPGRLRGVLTLARVGDSELCGGVVAMTMDRARKLAERQFYRRPWEFFRVIRAESADLCEEVLAMDAEWHREQAEFEGLMEFIRLGRVSRARP